ncbi:MAG: AAA family ATPase [Alphaproteobacteria bacterium]|nr:AAA family ATPase [Alphaproteobacteria bacterium]
MADDQREIIEFLSKPPSYGHGIERVDVIETHASLVFLAGERAYKLKRAVKYPYLDFSTVERRRQACEAELVLNRRTAPGLYLEVRAVARMPGGRVGFATDEPAIDWLVVMRRFEAGSLFDALAGTGRLTAPLIRELADHIAAFHQKAERRPKDGGAAALAAVIETNHRCLSEAPEAGFDSKRIDELRGKSLDRLAAVAALLDRRRAQGKVRRCHGDLHLRNVCLFEGKPTLFDCLEFSDELASVDVLYDLAFLLMDLEHHRLTDFANLALNRYLDLTGEDDGLAAMPLFRSSRAAIRAHVTATALARAAGSAAKLEMAAEARSYLDLALQYLRPRACRLVAIGGLSGSGKSTLAAVLAPDLGARVLRSDVIRKRLFGVAPETPLMANAYSPEASELVYDRLRRRAAEALAAGYSVIIDAVSLKPTERESFAGVAMVASVPFSGLWLEAPAPTMDGRLRTRKNDASDASPEVLALQLREDVGAMDWVRIDTAGGPADCLAAVRHALGLEV